MELLAPAGEWDALVAAINAGADAVYLGTNELNARRTAGNFDDQTLPRATDYAHERDVKLYVTVNIMVKQQELSLLERVAGSLMRSGVDAAIVQDLGAAAALQQMLPGLALHASTQMAIHNRQGVRYARRLGLTRVVLARELTFDEIAACAGEGVEIEAFAHGALCVSCSGQCLFSSMVGGRSGNRGLCAQPCRLPYRLTGALCEASGELLSPKDLMTLHHLGALERAGVTSLKIEGRLKSPDYVYTVTSAYRRALDGETADAAPLTQVFNRGYTPGYGPGVVDGEFLSDPSKLHVLKRTEPLPAPRARTVALTGTLTARTFDTLTLELSDGQDRVLMRGAPVERARNLPVDATRMADQVRKTGGTPYRIDALALHMDDDAFVPASALNALRRDALAELGRLRAARRRGCAESMAALVIPDVQTPAPAAPTLGVQSGDAQLLKRAADWGADELIWSPLDVTDEGLKRAPDVRYTLALPPVLSGDDLARLNRWAQNQTLIDGVIAENVAHLALDWPGGVRAGHMLNTANALGVQQLGMPYAPSLELTAAEIRALPGERELIVYGHMALMQLRHCPLNAALKGGRHADCRRCDRGGATINGHELIDRKRARFPLERLKTYSGCVVRVLNQVPLMLMRHVRRLPDATRWRIVLTRETPDIAEAVVRVSRAALGGADFKALPGWAALDALPSTTGHYFRGVE